MTKQTKKLKSPLFFVCFVIFRLFRSFSFILMMTMIVTIIPTQNAQAEKQYRLLVKKSERKLHLFEIRNGRDKLVRTYQIALGNNPIGHKKRQGDGATPEGDYYITHKNPKSNYYLSLGVSYPNIDDADAGLKSGLITKAQHQDVVSAAQEKKKPPQNTKLGGDIFIHGGGRNGDWTLGCVALENEEIKELFDLLPPMTPVRIEP